MLDAIGKNYAPRASSRAASDTVLVTEEGIEILPYSRATSRA